MRKGIIQVIISNIIYFSIGLISSFILPKFLSVETYSALKTYTLYLSYAGLLTLGYVDGILLKYGGKEINSISNKEFYKDLKNFIVLEAIISIISIIASYVIKDVVFLFFSIALIFENSLWYYRTFFQAVGKFKEYGKILNFQKIILLIVELVAIFIFKSDDSKVYLSITVIITIVMYIYFSCFINRKVFKITKVKIEKNTIISNIKSGFTLTLGNLANTFFTGIDRWFVKFLLTMNDFALYAFAVSLENIVNLFVAPISVSLYNYICKNLNQKYIRKVKSITLLWGIVIIAAAFPAKFILENYLTNYINSNKIIFYLFASQAFYAVIKGIYLNIYKATKQQNKYLKQTLQMTCIAILLNIVLFIIKPNMESFALGTFITSIIWFLICEKDSKNFRFSMKEYIFIIMEITGYLFWGIKFDAITGFIYYIIYSLVVSFLLMKDTILYLVKIIVEVFKSTIYKD